MATVFNEAPGKLLTTPSHLLKLIIPLTTGVDTDSGRTDIEPLALLVHPQQPLSYLERLIQSELPPIKNYKGEDKIPAVNFKAEDSQQDAIEPRSKHEKTDDTEEDMHEDAEDEGQMEETRFDDKTEKTGKLGKKAQALEDVALRENVTRENSTPKETVTIEDGTPKEGVTPRKDVTLGVLGDGGVESYSGAGHESSSKHKRKFVRWSTSTEIGDFIRDAARGKEFEVEIEGMYQPIRIGVPSFNDRTHYLRLRLRKTATKIIDLATIKKECDLAAHKGAQRVAIAGAGVLVAYWYVVYRLTFETDLGWDTVEPVTVSSFFPRFTSFN